MTRVLVVEDEMLVRELVIEDFSDAGFDVVFACNAREAMGLLERDADFGLVFTDIRMPGTVDGLGLGQYIRATWPTMPVIYATGFTDVSPDLGKTERLLKKPYRYAELSRMLIELGVQP